MSPPPRFLRYLNALHKNHDHISETSTFLIHCPYLAWRWNLVNIFVHHLDRWLFQLTRPPILNSLMNPDTVPYILMSLVRLHERWMIVSSGTEPQSDQKSMICVQNSSPWTAIYAKEFNILIDHMVNIGFHRYRVEDISKSCLALRYFVRRVANPVDSNEWPSKAWLSELMTWICRWMKRNNQDHRSQCDVSTGPILLSILSQFDEILPAGRYELVLRNLADLSKEKFRDFIAERRQSGIGVIEGRPVFCTLIPSPDIFHEFSSAWLKWDLDPDDHDLMPGSWRVWYEALHYAGIDYAQIGVGERKPKDSFVIRNAPVFSKLLVDMLTVARLFGKEAIFVGTGAKGTWEKWASLSAFCCKPHVAAWILEELENVEEIWARAKGVHAILPGEIARPELRRHLEYLASRKDFEMIE